MKPSMATNPPVIFRFRAIRVVIPYPIPGTYTRIAETVLTAGKGVVRFRRVKLNVNLLLSSALLLCSAAVGF